MNKSPVLKYRHKANLSQEELSRRCGISRQYLGLIEKDKSLPTVKIAMSIARELKCSLLDLWPPSDDEAA